MYGIGITTKDRPELLQALLNSILRYTFMDNVKIYVADDSIDKVGVSKKKNECLRNLKDCEAVFLMDDDIEIIKHGWIEFFVSNAKENHVMFLSDKLHNFSHQRDNVRFYNDCGGVFMYIPKTALRDIGAFDEKFEKYGFEHCNWSMRYADGKRIFMMLEGTEEYLYAHDYSNPNHKSSITDEEKKMHVRNNWDKFFKTPITQIYIPL